MQFTLLILLGFFLNACSSVQVFPLSGYYPREANLQKVDVYSTISEVKRAYEEIAILRVPFNENQEAQAEKLSKQAQEIGADAVILKVTSRNSRKVAAELGKENESDPSDISNEATAIVYIR